MIWAVVVVVVSVVVVVVMSSKVDVLFNFGISIFGRVRVKGIVTGLGVTSSSSVAASSSSSSVAASSSSSRRGVGGHDDDNDDELQQIFNNIDNTIIESTDDNNVDDDTVDGCDSTSTSTSTSAVILSNGQHVVLGIVVYPPDDWIKGGKSIDEFYSLFEKYRDFLFFSYSLDDGKGDDNYEHMHSTNDNKLIPITASMQHVNKSPVDLSKHASIKVQQTKQGVLITHVSKLQLRQSLLGKDMLLSLALILSLSATEHVNSTSTTSTTNTTALDNVIIQEERDIRKLLEMNRYHPPGIPERSVTVKVNVIDSLSLSVSTQELNQKSCMVMLKLSNIHPTNTIYVSDTTILLNHTRLDWRSFLDSIDEGYDDKRDDIDDFDDYSEGVSGQSSDDQSAIHVDDFFPAHLFFDIKRVCSAADKGTSHLFLKVDPHHTHNLVYIITLKEVDTHKIIKLPATHFTTPCVIEWSHCRQQHLSSLITQDNFRWSCASSLISSHYKDLLSESTKARLYHEGLGDRVKAVTKVKVSFQGPQYSYKGTPMKLEISLVNITKEDIGRFQLYFERIPKQSLSIPFIIQENSHIVNGLKGGESVTMTITVLPLKAGNLMLDGLKIRLIERSEQSDGFLSIAHSFQIHVYESY